MGILDGILGGTRKRRRKAKRTRKLRTYKVYDGNETYLDTVEARSPTHAIKQVFFRRFGVRIHKTSKIPRSYFARHVKA